MYNNGSVILEAVTTMVVVIAAVKVIKSVGIFKPKSKQIFPPIAKFRLVKEN